MSLAVKLIKVKPVSMNPDAKLTLGRGGIATSGTRRFAGHGTSSRAVSVGHEGQKGGSCALDTWNPADQVREDKNSVEHSLDESTILSAMSLRYIVPLVS